MDEDYIADLGPCGFCGGSGTIMGKNGRTSYCPGAHCCDGTIRKHRLWYIPRPAVIDQILVSRRFYEEVTIIYGVAFGYDLSGVHITVDLEDSMVFSTEEEAGKACDKKNEEWL